jgi:anti-sigma regulatory factor (Ser/Thr protein kinase)
MRIPNAVPLARRLVREWLRHWDAPTDVSDAGVLIASEFVTNTVTHTHGRTIRLRIRWASLVGHVEVWDASPVRLLKRSPDETDTGGRGLLLVEAYSSRWGYYPSAGGKVVWAELAPHRTNA